MNVLLNINTIFLLSEIYGCSTKYLNHIHLTSLLISMK